jgi:hypothetical protein
MLIYTEDRDTFIRDLLMTKPIPARPGHAEVPSHFKAPMLKRAEKFIGGMADRTRDLFLETALDFAWTNRHSFNPQYEALEMFWTRCLQGAARTRDKWLVSVAMLPGVYERRWVLGRMLGE